MWFETIRRPQEDSEVGRVAYVFQTRIPGVGEESSIEAGIQDHLLRESGELVSTSRPYVEATKQPVIQETSCGFKQTKRATPSMSGGERKTALAFGVRETV